MEEEQKKPIDNSIHSEKDETDSDLSHSPKKQKKNDSKHYQDLSLTEKTNGYCSFSSTNKTTKPSNPIQQLLDQVPTNPDSDDEDDQRKKIAAAKKLLFPDALATSFSEVADTLRNERRQEFCPIYKDETPEQIALRQSKQKPVGSLLAKRIRWDDLKRKREEEEKKAQMQFQYGPYGAIHTNQQQSFANPYEQYYTAMHNQYEQMIQISRTQHEHSGFWPEYHQQQQPTVQNNDLNAQNSMQQIHPYTYPYLYPSMYPTSYTSTDYNSYLNSIRQPPPPPPDEPYPY